MSASSSLKTNGQGWKELWQHRSFKFQFCFFLLCIVGIALFFPRYFDYLEGRNGTFLNDLIVCRIPATDVSWLVFFLLYSGMVIGLVCSLRYPKVCLIIMQTYVLVTVMRIITLYFFPLNPPEGYIALKEPILSLFFTTNGIICSKDLFFSGHVSTILSLYYPVKQKLYKNIILAFSIMIGLLVLIQHVHYTIDVLVSPVATYACYLFAKNVLSKKYS